VKGSLKNIPTLIHTPPPPPLSVVGVSNSCWRGHIGFRVGEDSLERLHQIMGSLHEVCGGS
jgi:hypothetical protein